MKKKLNLIALTDPVFEALVIYNSRIMAKFDSVTNQVELGEAW